MNNTDLEVCRGSQGAICEKARPAGVLLNTLTSMRFFAALAVVVHHSGPIWAHTQATDVVRQVGWLGVTFFFTLSGFVLMWNFKPTDAYSSFILRRLIRIYPMHALGTGIAIVFYFIYGNPYAGYVSTPIETVANFALVHDWLPAHQAMRQGWNGVSWTLSCEFFFYLIAPILFTNLIRRHRLMLWVYTLAWFAVAMLAIVSAAARWEKVSDFLTYHPLPNSLEFMLGAFAAAHIRAGSRVPPFWIACLVSVVPLTIYCCLISETSGTRTGAVMIALFAPGAVMLIAAAAQAELREKHVIFGNPLLVYLGEASFSLYIVHALILAVFGLYTLRLFPSSTHSIVTGEIERLVYVASTVLFSAACFRLIETPIRRSLFSLIRPGT